jgi:hypothetical protein
LNSLNFVVYGLVWFVVRKSFVYYKLGNWRSFWVLMKIVVINGKSIDIISEIRINKTNSESRRTL